MKPRVLRQKDYIQISYDLPHRSCSTKRYPVASPNGSSILVYGHEHGIRIIWYGGRPYRSAKAQEQPPTVNGSKKDGPMVIDLDEDDSPQPQTAPSVAEFEDEEQEVDPAKPYRHILREIDIATGAAVTSLAVPPVSSHVAHKLPNSDPVIITKLMLIAVGCSDNSVQLFTLPLAPPPLESFDPARWNTPNLKIYGSNGHQDLVSSIAITLTADAADTDGDGEQSKSRSRSRNRLATAVAKGSGKLWSILVASTSCTGSGLLLIHQIPVSNDGKFSSNPDDVVPIQRRFVRTDLSSCTLSFNPSPFPSERHSNLLIGLLGAGCAKIYQVIDSQAHSRGRRGSAVTVDSAASSSKSSRPFATQSGKFLITLHNGFTTSDEISFLPRRKGSLDASWILGGRAILVLLDDGEWGVWDVEAAGPSSTSTTQNLVKGKNNVAGLQGGSLTRFALRGSLGSMSDQLPTTGFKDPSNTKSSGLAPMTPHTRKVRSEELFRGSDSGPSASTLQTTTKYGKICVTQQESPNNSAAPQLPDESILLSYQESRVFIPSLLAYWRSQVTSKGSFDVSNVIRPNILPTIRLGDDREHSSGVLSIISRYAPEGLFGATRTASDVFVATDMRLIFLVSPIADPDASDENANHQALPLRVTALGPLADQYLLTEGQLDVDGMDRILEGMANSTGPPHALPTSMFGNSVAFRDEDDPIDVGTPTPKMQIRSGKLRGRFDTSTARPEPSKPRGRIFT